MLVGSWFSNKESFEICRRKAGVEGMIDHVSEN